MLWGSVACVYTSYKKLLILPGEGDGISTEVDAAVDAVVDAVAPACVGKGDGISTEVDAAVDAVVDAVAPARVGEMVTAGGNPDTTAASEVELIE